jgi:hypothetical protein
MNMNIRASKLGALQMGPKNEMAIFSKKVLAILIKFL